MSIVSKLFYVETSFAFGRNKSSCGTFQGNLRQIEVTEKFSVSQSATSKLWRRFRETGSSIKQHPGRRRCTTAIQDQYLTLTGRRQPFLTTPELVTEL